MCGPYHWYTVSFVGLEGSYTGSFSIAGCAIGAEGWKMSRFTVKIVIYGFRDAQRVPLQEGNGSQWS